MKPIRKVDKKSNFYITHFDVVKDKSYGGSSSQGDKDNKVIDVHMSNGSKTKCPNIPKNREKLLKIMWKQHDVNKGKLNSLKNKSRKFIMLALTSGLCTIAGGAFLGIANLYDLALPMELLYGLIGTCGAATFGTLAVDAKTVSNIKDIEKNEFLKKNEEILNSADLEDENCLLNINSFQLYELHRINGSKKRDEIPQNFDINSINSLSLDTLKTLKANLERENYLGLSRSKDKTANEAHSSKQYVKR